VPRGGEQAIDAPASAHAAAAGETTALALLRAQTRQRSCISWYVLPVTRTRKPGRKSLSGAGDSPQIRVRVSPSAKTGLAEIAACDGVAVSDVVRRAVEREIQTHRPRRPEEWVQLELHRRIIPKLLEDREGVRASARQNLLSMRQRRQSPTSRGWIEQWDCLLDGPLENLLAVLLSTDERGVDLRQMSPFAGALSDAERREAILTGRALAQV
jgi:hypothetical protein